MHDQGFMPQGSLAGIWEGRDEWISPGAGAQHNLPGGAYQTAAIPHQSGDVPGAGAQHSLPGGASETGASKSGASNSGGGLTELHALVS